MKHFISIACALALLASVASAQEQQPAPVPQGQTTRDADAILNEYRNVQMPPFQADKRQDNAYIQKYIQEMNAARQRQADLAWELYEKDPKHPRAMLLLTQRWQTLSMLGKSDQVAKETDQVLKSVSDPGQKADVLFSRAQALMMNYRDLGTKEGVEKAMKSAEEFIQASPGDERGAMLLLRVADASQDSDLSLKLLKRIVETYPTSRAASQAGGKIRQADGVGKPFELAFKDAITGKAVSVADLKGKVVVVDFWATWCGPCIAEMPNMKKLYASFKPRGVEFIGVSLDQPEANGGLQKLKDYCAENQVTWPQYYQGNYWDSEFSKSWGINAIPCVFIVDADGKLFSTEARGKLEELIPQLLKQRDQKLSSAR